MSQEQRIALLDASYTLQAQINTLRRGLPIAEAKARTAVDRLKIRKRYNDKIAALQTQIKALSAAIWPECEVIS